MDENNPETIKKDLEKRLEKIRKFKERSKKRLEELKEGETA